MVDIFAEYISQFFNESVSRGKFPDISKQADITPVFKKAYRGSIDNYPPDSILPSFQKFLKNFSVNN